MGSPVVCVFVSLRANADSQDSTQQQAACCGRDSGRPWAVERSAETEAFQSVPVPLPAAGRQVSVLGLRSGPGWSQPLDLRRSNQCQRELELFRLSPPLFQIPAL